MENGTKKTIIWENNSEPPKNYIWVKEDGVAYDYDETSNTWVKSKLQSGNGENSSSSANFIELLLPKDSMIPNIWIYGESVYNEEIEDFETIDKICNIDEISSIAKSIFENNESESYFQIDFGGVYENIPEVTSNTIISGISFILDKNNNSLTINTSKTNTTSSGFGFWGIDFNINGTTKEYWVPEIRF